MRNFYYKRSKLNARRFRQILRLFALDLTAWDAARMSGVSVRSVRDNTFYLHVKECEFRFSHRRANFYAMLLKLLRDGPI